ncbi:MAG: ABC transporter substrate-binding protein, partial [Chloroflexota bacterium]
QFKLREGVKFHNGEPWNARAGKFTIDLIPTFTRSTARSAVGEIAGTEIVDEYTLNVITKSPSGIAIWNLSHATMYPPTWSAESGRCVVVKNFHASFPADFPL